MYAVSDLDTLFNALNAFTSDGFTQYDINTGQITPYLSITLSNTETQSFPVFYASSQGRELANLYYTTDFTPPIATFISNFQAGVAATVDSNTAILTAISAFVTAWPAFVAAYQSKG
jgi:hypothetical protein